MKSDLFILLIPRGVLRGGFLKLFHRGFQADFVDVPSFICDTLFNKGPFTPSVSIDASVAAGKGYIDL